MPLDFPNSPTTGDIFNGAGVSWRWDGVKWTSVLSTGGPFLPLSGGTISGDLGVTGALGVTGTFYLGSDMQMGTAVGAAPASVTIRTPNGSNINLLPQGTGHVLIGTGAGELDCGPIHMEASFNGSTHGFGVTNGLYQEMGITGTYSETNMISVNQLTVPYDNLAKPGQALFNTGIFHNFGGSGFSGNRGGMLINMVQTGAVSGSSGAGGIEALHSSAVTTDTFGGPDPGPGAAGAVFAGNFYTIMRGGSRNLQGTCGIEIDVEANTGAIYHDATGMVVVTTSGHTQAPIDSTAGYVVAGQTNSLGFTYGMAFYNWGMQAGSTLMIADWSPDRPTFPVARGIDFRSVTFSGDAFSAAGTSITSTGAVRVGTGYFNSTATGASIHVDGAICTAGTLTASVTTAYPLDGNTYYAEDAYGGIWQTNYTGGGSSTITAIALVVPGYVQGTLPTNPVTLAPRGRLKIFVPGTITANLTWDTSRHGLTLQGSGGPLILSNLPTSAAGLIAGQVWRNGTVLNVV